MKDDGILVNYDDNGNVVEDEVVADERAEVEQEVMLDLPEPPEPHEAQRPKTMRAPSAPSRQERAEHDITHCPFRSWCEKCVAGKSHAKSHFSGQAGSPEGEVPLVAFDYAFMSDKAFDKVLKPDSVGVGDSE